MQTKTESEKDVAKSVEDEQKPVMQKRFEIEDAANKEELGPPMKASVLWQKGMVGLNINGTIYAFSVLAARDIGMKFLRHADYASGDRIPPEGSHTIVFPGPEGCGRPDCEACNEDAGSHPIDTEGGVTVVDLDETTKK